MIYRVGRWRTVRPAALWTFFGGILASVTIILSALNLGSAQQSIALAVPALVMTIGGLINTLVPDSWTAWRRGFKQGCRVGAMCQRDAMFPSGTTTQHANGTATPYQNGTATPVSLGQHGQHGLPPAL
ncbi:MAG: hypothetical protein ACLQFR_02795 [Streptosporangiaceae bacterium]